MADGRRRRLVLERLALEPHEEGFRILVDRVVESRDREFVPRLSRREGQRPVPTAVKSAPAVAVASTVTQETTTSRPLIPESVAASTASSPSATETSATVTVGTGSLSRNVTVAEFAAPSTAAPRTRSRGHYQRLRKLVERIVEGRDREHAARLPASMLNVPAATAV